MEAGGRPITDPEKAPKNTQNAIAAEVDPANVQRM